MAHAYTPGLKVTARTTIRKVRRLPIRGEVLVEEGQQVAPDTVVARAHLPGDPETINVAHRLSVDPEDVEEYMTKHVGDQVREDEVIAEYRAFFGLFKYQCKAPCDGTIEHISPVTGQVTIRRPPVPVEVDAYIRGTVKEVLAEEGVVVETTGALIQGIFGVGGEAQGVIDLRADSPDDVLDAAELDASCRGKVVVGGSLVTAAALRKADELGVAGVVCGGIIDRDLVEFLGYDIGVAITGQEDINVTLIITEGFGRIRMADRTFALLKDLEGHFASINGATQIRAGVLRPEVIVPGDFGGADSSGAEVSEGLVPGMPIRIIRQPYFGLLATVVELPPDLKVIETEAKVRILRARLEDGREVIVPRANVEIIEQ